MICESCWGDGVEPGSLDGRRCLACDGAGECDIEDWDDIEDLDSDCVRYPAADNVPF